MTTFFTLFNQYGVLSEERAYYRPSTDTVNVPAIELFETAEEYYSTTYHEMIHYVE